MDTCSLTHRLIIAALLVALPLAAASCASPGVKPTPQLADQVRYLSPEVAQQAAAAVSPGGRLADVPPATGPLELTVEQAVLVALENNQALVVEKLNPPIVRTLIEQQRAVFDPVLRADFVATRDRNHPARTAAVADNRTTSLGGGVSLEQYLPTGTAVSLDLTSDRFWRRPLADFHATRLGLTVTQSLLRDFGVEVNLVSLRQARLDLLGSQYELRGFAEGLVAEVERAYWQAVLAEKGIAIVENAYKLAEQQLNETSERIEVGRLAETELAASQAELARRRENLINARSALETSRLRLSRLLNPAAVGGWQRPLVTLSEPQLPESDELPMEASLANAMQLRPDLNQARLAVQRNELELVRTRNGLLPQLDLFITLGRTGYADSFGESWRDLASGDSYDILGGLAFAYPPYNRDARARHERALFTREQAQEAVTNLAQLIELDVRTAYVELQRTREQVAATAATRQFQEESLRAETEKFRVGTSTSLLVAQAQRDLLTAQLAEVAAAVNYMIAQVELHRLDGSLLERRGIDVGPEQ